MSGTPELGIDEQLRAVLRLLGGTAPLALAEELGVPPGVLDAWREAFLAGATAALEPEATPPRPLDEAAFRELFYNSFEALVLVEERPGAPAGLLGRGLAANPAACAMFLRTEEEMLAETRIFLVDSADPRLPPLLAELARSGHARGELVMRRADGTRFPCELAVTRYVGQAGTRRSIAVFRDVSERSEMDRKTSEFVSTVSHELRTPLASIQGSLGLLEGGVAGALPPTVRQLLEIGRASANRLIRLINEMLDLEKLEAGHMSLSRTLLELREITTAAVSEVEAEASARGVILSTAIPGRLGVAGDPDRLVQVVATLLTSAIGRAPAGSTVELEAWEEDERVVVAITDRGPGIPVDRRASLFRKFQAQDSRRDTGLGLAISKSIVEQHGGTIEVDVAAGAAERAEGEGEGVTFRICLPALRELEGHAPGPEALLVVGPGSERALLVEIVQTEGYVVTLAPSAERARALLETRTPALIVATLGSAAPEAAAKLAAALAAPPSRPPVPTLVVAPEGALVPGAEHLPRPLDVERLRATVRRLGRIHDRPRVLVADDDAATRTLIARALDWLPIECVEAGTGEQLLRLASSLAPELIVMDLFLAHVDGFEVVARLREAGLGETALIVHSSAELGPVDRRRLALGPTRYLVKTQTGLDELVTHVRDLLGRAR